MIPNWKKKKDQQLYIPTGRKLLKEDEKKEEVVIKLTRV